MNPKRRSTFQFKYKKVDLISLQKLSAKVTSVKLTSFVKDYRRILNILDEKMDMMIAVTISQFYNPPLCCFTFSNFQLAPTLEEFERIIGQNLRDHNPLPKFDEGIPPKRITLSLSLKVSKVVVNWDVKGIFNGFSRKFLEDQALKMEKDGNWKAFYVMLAMLVYEIVLFPNIDHFVDHLAVRIFFSGNPVPFLLADLHYALHDCHEKKGRTILCCTQLLHAWFRSHMPEEGPFVSKELKPSQKLASLTSSHVEWYIMDWETEDVIVSTRDFPNVPLIGTRGCINYNPVLSFRKHGYTMNDPLRAEALEPFILHNTEANHSMVKNIKRSWKTIIRKGKELGKRNVIAREPYTYWVKERVQMVKLPFSFDPSIYPLVPEPEPIIPEDVEKLNA
ncbi:uncharacterized protein LOC127095482 [Lathyrus oleraceus]|uniref:uncharacterized protein LOC127095482 n=1 Tax=Pisum sativum TaxID=3888 RepID=UPI0021D1E00F|nr:uncharacterized protein LOC127095482 [Pisum sativum]